MTQYYGDFAEDATVYIPFNTFDSNDPSASVTITNLADADIKVHKDGGLTQIVTDGATVVIDFDSITGNHLITIDTSAHADYAVGSDYLVRIEGTTVDAGTVNAWVGSFSIENRFDEVDVVKYLGATADAAMDSDDIAAAVLDAAKSSHTTAGTIGKSLADTETATGVAQADLDIITGSDGVTLATAQALYAPSKTSEIVTNGPLVYTGGVIPANIVVVDGTTIPTPGTAGVLDVNIQSINDALVIGDGDATSWDGV